MKKVSVKDSEKEGEKEGEKKDDNTSQVGGDDLIHVICKCLPRSKSIKYAPWSYKIPSYRRVH